MANVVALFCLYARSSNNLLSILPLCSAASNYPPHPPPPVDGCNINEHILAGLLVKLQANPVILKRPRPRRSSVPVDIALFTNCQQDGTAAVVAAEGGRVRGPSLG